MRRFRHIRHISFLLAIMLFSGIYYFELRHLPLPAEREFVDGILCFLLFFVLLQLFRLVFRSRLKKSSMQNFPAKSYKSSWKERALRLIRNKSFILLLASSAYLPAIFILGLITASFLFIITLSWALGAKSIKEIVLTPTLVLFVIYVFFVIFLDIRFPKGILF